jgi:predicted transcriptional regulator
MSKTVTLRLDDVIYRKLRSHAESDNRPLSNFIETAVLRYVENSEFVGEFEMAEIRNNTSLNGSIKRGFQDAKERRGRFA